MRTLFSNFEYSQMYRYGNLGQDNKGCVLLVLTSVIKASKKFRYKKSELGKQFCLG